MQQIGNISNRKGDRNNKEVIKMAGEKFKKACEVVNALKEKTIKIKAKDEKQAVAKLNKAMKNTEGYGFKVYKHKGYYGKYVIGKTFKNHYTGTEYLEFNLKETEDGFFEVADDLGGYKGID